MDPTNEQDNREGFFHFQSKAHERQVDLKRFAEFIDEYVQLIPEDHLRDHLKEHRPLLERIARGYDIWDRTKPETKAARLKSLTFLGGLLSHSQPAERAVKNQNYAGSNYREEKAVSIRSAAIGYIKEVCR